MAIRNCEPARTHVPTFKSGDKVRCLWAKNSNGTLTVGNVYTIQIGNTDGASSVSIEGIEGAFDHSRFELVKQSTKVSWPKASRPGRVGIEKIMWVDASIRLPDDDITVLVKTADYVGAAVLEEGEWNWINAMPCPAVQYWAEMPVGPNGGEV